MIQDDTTQTDGRTALHLRVEPKASARDRIRERLAAIDRGEDVEDRSVVIVDSTADLAHILSEKNLELLDVIAREQPGSMREAARLTDRGIAEVSTNLNALAEYGLVDLVQDGRSKRPVVWYDTIDVEIALASHEDADSEARATA